MGSRRSKQNKLIIGLNNKEILFVKPMRGKQNYLEENLRVKYLPLPSDQRLFNAFKESWDHFRLSNEVFLGFIKELLKTHSNKYKGVFFKFNLIYSRLLELKLLGALKSYLYFLKKNFLRGAY